MYSIIYWLVVDQVWVLFIFHNHIAELCPEHPKWMLGVFREPFN